jgi:phospholipase/lecithinase/hemolysin
MDIAAVVIALLVKAAGVAEELYKTYKEAPEKVQAALDAANAGLDSAIVALRAGVAATNAEIDAELKSPKP